MIKYVSLLCALIVVSISPSYLSAKDTETVEAARDLLASINFEQTITDSIEASLDAQMREFAQMGLPPEGIKVMKKEMFSFFLEVMTYEKMEPEVVKIYAEAFTAEEMRELIKFYETPVGKKTIQLLPQLTTKAMVIGQNMVQERSQELQQRIIPVFQKYLPVDPAPIDPIIPKE